MTKQQEALRIAGKFLRLQAMGYVATAEECKSVSNLCFITLPMKYRLDKNELHEMGARLRIAEGLRLNGKTVSHNRKRQR